jgi:HAE1 family hydrophobic/amphiphilic exporter-1
VVVEAVEQHIEQGLSPKDATFQAMQEVSGPVVSIALIPGIGVHSGRVHGGIQGRLNKQFAITIAISVMISAFNALTLSPALAAMLLRSRRKPPVYWGASSALSTGRSRRRRTAMSA